jgi:hypothetical protein
MHVPADTTAWTAHVYAELFFYVGLVATVAILALAAIRRHRS